MNDVVGKFAQGFFVRVLPGLINVGVLLLIGEWIGPEEYGEYSTVVAASGLISSVLFGPIAFSIVPYHARFESGGQRTEFESSVIVIALAISICISLIGAAGVAMGLVPLAYVVPGMALGLYTIAQEILRARVKFWSYGLASIVQSAILLGGALSWVNYSRDASSALHTFSLSYLFGFFVALALNGGIGFVVPMLSVFKSSLREGGRYTGSVALEGALSLGLRFMALHLGSPQLLGIFSFGLDLAQRIVGIFANITSFTVVPAAFKDHVSDREVFRKTLLRGAAFAAGVCLFALLSVISVSFVDWVPGLGVDLFDREAFLIVSFGVIANRLKKIAIDQLAFFDGRAATVSTGLLFAVPAAFLVAFVVHSYTPSFAEISYLSAYVISAATTFFLLYKKRRSSGGV